MQTFVRIGKEAVRFIIARGKARGNAQGEMPPGSENYRRIGSAFGVSAESVSPADKLSTCWGKRREVNTVIRIKTSRMWLLFWTVVLMVASAAVCFGDILLQDDFEEGKLDKKTWVGAGTWKIEKDDGNHVLDIQGGGEGLSVKNDFTDFIIEYDLKLLGGTGYNGVVLRAQDVNNLYMIQVAGPGSATPSNIRWHTKIGGAYAVFAKPIESGLKIDTEVWYRVRFEVEGKNFKCYVVEKEKAPEPELASWPKDLLASTWENGQFKQGTVGFRMSGAEHSQFDNVIVTTIGHAKAVSSKDNLIITWGLIKNR